MKKYFKKLLTSKFLIRDYDTLKKIRDRLLVITILIVMFGTLAALGNLVLAVFNN